MTKVRRVAAIAVAAALLLQALQVIPVTLIGLALAPEFMRKRLTADG